MCRSNFAGQSCTGHVASPPSPVFFSAVLSKTNTSGSTRRSHATVAVLSKPWGTTMSTTSKIVVEWDMHAAFCGSLCSKIVRLCIGGSSLCSLSWHRWSSSALENSYWFYPLLLILVPRRALWTRTWRTNCNSNFSPYCDRVADMSLLIIDSIQYSLILWYPWLCRYNLLVDWERLINGVKLINLLVCFPHHPCLSKPLRSSQTFPWCLRFTTS